MGLQIDAIAVVPGDRLHHDGRKLADRAIIDAVAGAGITTRDLDLLLNAGIYHDRSLCEPALAALIQEDVGANPEDPHEGGHGTFSFDVTNGAAGALSALEIADGFLSAGTIDHAVVVAGDSDPGHGMAPVFPYDAAAAALVCSRAGDERGILGSRWINHPDGAGLRDARLGFEDGRNRLRFTESESFAAEGAALAAKATGDLLAELGLTMKDISVVAAAPFEPAFLDELAGHLGSDGDKVMRPRTGLRLHTSGLIAALADVYAAPPASDGERVLLVGVGAGIVAGAAVLVR